MSLSAGTRIGAYEIVAAIGAGGMGEVYRARDTKLNRDVALKILPAAFSTDPDRLTRFKREAVVLASLNHTNIASIYGFEDSQTTHALVMELVEGDDLSTLIARSSALAISDVVPIARQIAEALETAHDSGIVHRDLKPANIKVRADGTVKVLDFGLAKAMTSDPGSGAEDQALQNSPTLTARATQMGMIIGTAAYMAPEQAKGKPVDKRADIWAFGIVLYEMLTGKRAFEGEDISTTLAAVLMKEPEWTALPADTPPALKTLILRCLERDPKARLRDIGEARLLLSDPEKLRAPSATQPAAGFSSTRARGSRLSWLVAAAGIVLAGAAGFYFARATQPQTATAAPVQFTIDAPVTGATQAIGMTLSPNGQYLAYLGVGENGNTNSAIWIRAMNDVRARVLPGTEGALWPFWAPDNRRVGFVAGGKLKWIDVTAGTPQTICDLSNTFFGGTWSADGTIVIAQGNSVTTIALFRVSERGGALTLLLEANRSAKQTALYFPAFLPDGRHFLYLAWSNEPAERSIWLGSLDGGAQTQLIKAASQGIYTWDPATHTGAIMFHREGALMAQPFDAAGGKITGDPIRIADNILFNRLNGRAAFSAAQNGTRAFREGGSIDPISDLVWVNREGRVLSTAGEPGTYNQIRMSPDEKRVAVSLPAASTSLYNIWSLELGNRILTQATFEESANDPIWSADSQSLAFEAMPKGKRDFFQQMLGRRGTTLIFESPDDPKWLDDWSHDGKYVLFHTPRPSKLYAIEIGNDGKAGPPTLLAENPNTIDGAHFSPDGKWVTYMTSESGENEVWAAAFPAFDRRRRVSSHGGGQPFWRGDGRELFYLTADGKMMSVAASPVAGANGSTNIEFRAPVEMFQSPLLQPMLATDQYSVTRDGQRFLFLQPKRDQRATSSPITIRIN